jgi:hypothetical protein
MASLDLAPRPREELEDRIVAGLRARALLRRPALAVTRASSPSALRRMSPWLVGAAAATVAFVFGLRAGEARAERNDGGASATVATGDGSEATALIRAAAYDYVSALSTASDTDRVARAAAIATFRTAADQIIRLAPESDIAAAIGLAFPTSFVSSPATDAKLVPARRVVWF